MKDWRTSSIAIAKIIVLVGGITAWLTKVATLQEAVAAMVLLGGSLSALGFVASKDSASPEILSQITAKQEDGKLKVSISAQPEVEKEPSLEDAKPMRFKKKVK